MACFLKPSRSWVGLARFLVLPIIKTTGTIAPHVALPVALLFPRPEKGRFRGRVVVCCRGVAQLVARVVRGDEVAGSSPVTPTSKQKERDPFL